MITAIVLIRVERGRVDAAAEALLELDEVKEVYSVAGVWDLVAMVRVRSYDQMAQVVPVKLARLAGIVRTTTLMAFECYSRRDLDRLWGIGMEDEAAAGPSA